MVILASTAPHMEFPLPGYNYVELRVAFKEDLHPFYPPTIAVLRPQLYGRCLATATHKDFCDSHIYIYTFIYAEMWPTMGQQCDMLASLAEDMMSKQPLPATHGCSSKDGALFSLRPQNSELLCQALKSLERVPRLEADLESRTE